jgi:hypothetical protein
MDTSRQPSGFFGISHHLKGGLFALLDERIGIHSGRFDVSTGVVASKCAVNTSRYLVGVE